MEPIATGYKARIKSAMANIFPRKQTLDLNFEPVMPDIRLRGPVQPRLGHSYPISGSYPIPIYLSPSYPSVINYPSPSYYPSSSNPSSSYYPNPSYSIPNSYPTDSYSILSHPNYPNVRLRGDRVLTTPNRIASFKSLQSHSLYGDTKSYIGPKSAFEHSLADLATHGFAAEHAHRHAEHHETRIADLLNGHGIQKLVYGDTKSNFGPKSASEHSLADPVTNWFAAEHAHRHAEHHETRIADLLEGHGIQKHQLIILSGFDDCLVRNGGGYLEQIHIMTSAEVDDASFLSELGRICSPFPAVLFTPSRSFEIPVYKHDGSTWQRDELIYHKAKQLNIGTLRDLHAHSGAVNLDAFPPFLSHSNSSTGKPSSIEPFTGSGNGSEDRSTHKKDKGKQKADDLEDDRMQDDEPEDDGDPESDPEGNSDPRADVEGKGIVVINLVSEIYSNQERMREQKQGDFQTISMRVAFSVKASEMTLKIPSVDVKFTDLRYGSKRKAGNIAYNQHHLRVEVSSGVETADISGISPCRTSAFERAVIDKSTTKQSGSGGINVSGSINGLQPSVTWGLNGTMLKERSDTLEKTRLLGQIAETSSDGTTCWDFTIDDPSSQACGVHLLEDRLPSLRFRFPARELPRRVTAAVASLWSLNTPDAQSQTWISKLFGGSSSSSKSMPVYSNLCQVIIVGVSPKIEGEHQHKTKMFVNSGNASLDYHTRTECVSPPTTDVDVKTDVTNGRHMSNLIEG